MEEEIKITPQLITNVALILLVLVVFGLGYMIGEKVQYEEDARERDFRDEYCECTIYPQNYTQYTYNVQDGLTWD